MNERKRILHLRTVVGRGGGPEKTLLNSHRQLEDAFDVRVLYLHPRGDREFDLPSRAEKTGAQLTAVGECGPCDPWSLYQVAREVRRFRPHVIHGHDYKTDCMAVGLARWYNAAAVTTLHGNVTLSTRLNFYYRIARFALRRMHKVIAVSSDLVRFAENAGVPGERCVLIENGVDTDAFRRTSDLADAKRRLGLDPGELVFGAVGRLMPEKGFDVLIRSFARLPAGERPSRLVIAGDGPERPRLAELISSQACRDRIQLLGHRTDVADVLQACDVFVLSSRREASPNVVLEAMATETPVIATRIAGVPGIIDDGRYGLLVEPDDESSLVAAMTRAADDEQLRKKLAIDGRARVQSQYSFEQRMRKERAVYESLLAGRAA